jgi:glutamyl-tRNA synthetase
MSDTVRTRFAPSPTGRLHLGNVRVAVFNWLFTRHHGGSFVLRIEDTDVERNVEGAEEALMEDLRWLGLDWDEGPDVGGDHGPYRQSERGSLYHAALEALLQRGVAYRCFCREGEGSDETRRYPGTCRSLGVDEAASRAAKGEPHVLRLRTPDEGDVEINDEVRGTITFPCNDIDDFVLRRGDGRPTYNFAVVVDDVTMEITHVIRGAGHLSNTPKQALLFDAMGVERPRFVHLPNVLAPDGGKLSKRHGATGVGELRQAGMLPEAIVNYLSLLGWSHPEEKEILSRDDLVASVDLDRVRAAEMAYDPEKLRWVASQHLARISLEDLVAGVRPFVDRGRFPVSDQALPAAMEALRSRLAAFGEVNDHLVFLYPQDGPAWDRMRAELRSDAGGRRVVSEARVALGALEEWDREAVRGAFKEVGLRADARGPGLFHPLRKAICATESGPDLGWICVALGREEVLDRLDRTLGGSAPPGEGTGPWDSPAP